MTRSIFDPTGPDTERSGSRNLGPDARNISHMPSSVTDGEVSEQEVRDTTGASPSAPDENATTEAIATAAAEVTSPERADNPDASLLDKDDNLSNPGQEARR